MVRKSWIDMPYQLLGLCSLAILLCQLRAPARGDRKAAAQLRVSGDRRTHNIWTCYEVQLENALAANDYQGAFPDDHFAQRDSRAELEYPGTDSPVWTAAAPGRTHELYTTPDCHYSYWSCSIIMAHADIRATLHIVLSGEGQNTSTGDRSSTDSATAAEATITLDSRVPSPCIRQGSSFQPLLPTLTSKEAVPGMTSFARGTASLRCPALLHKQLHGLHSLTSRSHSRTITEAGSGMTSFARGTASLPCPALLQKQLHGLFIYMRSVTTAICSCRVRSLLLLHYRLGHPGKVPSRS